MSNNKESVFGKNKFDEQNNAYLTFDPEKNNNTVKFKFLEDEPVVSENKFNKEQYTFEVMCLDTKVVLSHSITSRRYMRTLEKYAPLAGKSVCVQRVGEEMDIDYNVAEIK